MSIIFQVKVALESTILIMAVAVTPRVTPAEGARCIGKSMLTMVMSIAIAIARAISTPIRAMVMNRRSGEPA